MNKSPDTRFGQLEAHFCLCPTYLTLLNFSLSSVSPEHLHQLLTSQLLEIVDRELVQEARHTADSSNMGALRALMVIQRSSLLLPRWPVPTQRSCHEEVLRNEEEVLKCLQLSQSQLVKLSNYHTGRANTNSIILKLALKSCKNVLIHSSLQQS